MAERDNPFKLTKEEEDMMRPDWIKPVKKKKKTKIAAGMKSKRRLNFFLDTENDKVMKKNINSENNP